MDDLNGIYEDERLEFLDYGFLRSLLDFGCIEIEKEVVWNDLIKIKRFRPTNLGLYTFKEELENPLYNGTRPIKDLWQK